MAEEILTLRDLRSVNRAAYGARDKYEAIGLELGLQLDDLTNIEGKDNGVRLSRMLELWLKRPSLSPSWRKLVAALRAETVDRDDIASQIEKEYLKTDGVSQLQGAGNHLLSTSTPQQSQQGRLLSESDLPVLMRELSDSAHIAFSLGVQLHLSPSLVRTLQQQAKDPTDFLSLVLEQWLQQTAHPPTLQSLTDALSQAPIRNQVLAERLQRLFSGR